MHLDGLLTLNVNEFICRGPQKCALAAFTPTSCRDSVAMTDPNWQLRVYPVMHKAVECFSRLLESSKELLDHLLAKELLSPAQYRETLTDLRYSSPEDVSRWLLVDALSRRPPGSFDTFCSLLAKVEQGQTLLDVLVRSNDMRPNSEIYPNESHSLGRAPPPTLPLTGLQTQCPETTFEENYQSVAQPISSSGQKSGKVLTLDCAVYAAIVP